MSNFDLENNKKEDNYLPAYIYMVKLNYYFTITQKYIFSIKELEKSENFSDHTYAIELLSIQVLENLLKIPIISNICVKNKGLDEAALDCIVKDKIKSFGHRIDDLFNYHEDIKTELGVNSCIKFTNDFIDEYRVILNSGEIICFKNLEGIRYGSFAKNQNVVNGFQDFKKLISFLEKLSEIVHRKYNLENWESLKPKEN